MTAVKENKNLGNKDVIVESSNKNENEKLLNEVEIHHDTSVLEEANITESVPGNGDKCENENSLGGPSFYPPLYIQRYTFIKGILDTFEPESVVDFGSAEIGIFRHLKEVISLQRISLVDIDSSLLEVNKHRIRPQCYDYLQKRKNPLHVQIFEGSATEFDKRLVDYDAVTMVEFIEHLYEDDLQEVVKMVFECINPKFVVMTTPNYEFNQLFPGPRKFRHYDHKFEWTRSQFQAWCSEICEKYGYSSQFYGIGDAPESAELGCCSQAAVLSRKGDKQNVVFGVKEGAYLLVSESKYPHQEERSTEDILESELKYVISFMSRCVDFYDEDETLAYIPIERIANFKAIKCLCNGDRLRTFLSKKNYKMEKNSQNEDCVLIELYPEDNKGHWYGDDLSDEDWEQAEVNRQSNKSSEGEIIQYCESAEELWD